MNYFTQRVRAGAAGGSLDERRGQGPVSTSFLAAWRALTPLLICLLMLIGVTASAFPSITSVSPASVSAGGPDFTLTFSGTQFNSVTHVQFDFHDVVISSQTDTQIVATVPASLITNPRFVIVSVWVGSSGTGHGFNVTNSTPVIGSLSPNSATVGDPDTNITVTGSNFTSNSVVQWNGGSLSTAYVSSTVLTTTVPAADLTAAGSSNMTVYDPANGTSSPSSFAVNNIAPAATSLSPSSALAGDSDFTLTVNGSNFNGTSVIFWNGVPQVTTCLSGAQVTCAITAAEIASGGSLSVTVVNGGVGGGSTSPLTFTINNPAPVVSSLSPDRVVRGAATFTLTVNGSGFVAGSVIDWAGTPLTTVYVSSTQLTALVDASNVVSSGPVSVSVTNSLPGGGVASPLTFTVFDPAPSIVTITPDTGYIGDPDTTITVSGADFTANSVIRVNSTDFSTTFVSSSSLTAVIPASFFSAVSTAQVKVVDPNGTSNSVPVTVLNTIPAPGSLTPNSVDAGSHGFLMTVSGSNFNTTSVVNWSGVPLPTLYVSPTTLKVNVSEDKIATAGMSLVTVTNPGNGGGTSSPLLFLTNNVQPTVTQLLPSAAGAGSAGFTLTVNGDHFFTGSVVTWNGTPLATTLVGAMRLTAVVPANLLATIATATVTVTNPMPGGGAAAGKTFTIFDPTPVVTTLNPSGAHLGDGNTIITVYGSNFTPGSSVQWNGVSMTTYYGSGSNLRALVPAAKFTALTTASITVTDPHGLSNGAAFSVTNVAPVTTSLNHTQAVAGGSDFSLAVFGSNFNSTSVVKWNGVALPTIFVSGGALKATVSADKIAHTGTGLVNVTNVGVGGGTSTPPLAIQIVNPAPTITSLSATSAIVGAPTFTLTVNGGNFVPGSKVLWNGSERKTTFVSPTQLTAVVTYYDLGAVGFAGVTVANPLPGGGVSGVASFQILKQNAPAIFEISPSFAAVGSGDKILVVMGSNFNSNAAVAWNGAYLRRTTTGPSGATLVVTIPARLLASAGAAQITVVNPAPGLTSAPVAFEVRNPAPQITDSVSPSSVVAGAPATLVTLNGSNFVPSSVVLWAGSPLRTTYVSATKLTAVIPAASLAKAGTTVLSVSNPAPGGGVSGTYPFTIAPPTAGTSSHK